MHSSRDLVRDITACTPAIGQVAFWWLGQHSFIVKLCDAVLYLDPYLSDDPGRQVAPLLTPSDITNATLIFGSHDHGDHIDRPAWPALASASPEALFVIPDLLRERLAAELRIPIERLIGVNDGVTVEAAGLRITGIAAAHEQLDRDEVSGRYPYLGFVIEGNGCTVYHSGDCCIYEGLLTKLRRWPRFDVAFLPINGRDAVRFSAGCLGNMTYQEAVDLAGALRPGLTVPSHYDMFAGNQEDPAKFAEYISVKFPHVRYWIGPRYERVLVGDSTGE